MFNLKNASVNPTNRFIRQFPSSSLPMVSDYVSPIGFPLKIVGFYFSF